MINYEYLFGFRGWYDRLWIKFTVQPIIDRSSLVFSKLEKSALVQIYFFN